MAEIRSVVVTGGVGFVGGRIVRHLQEKHPHVPITVVDSRLPERDDQIAHVTYLQGDITREEEIAHIMSTVRPQVVVHTAGISPPLSERYARRIEKLVHNINVEGTRHTLRAAQQAGVEAFVYTSSCCAVTDDFSQSYANIDERWPLVEPGKASIYGESKAKAEKLVEAANTTTTGENKSRVLRTCSLRPAVIFGEGDYQLVPNIVNCILDKLESPYRLGDGMNLWDTVYVGNVADAHVLAVENLVSARPTAAGESFFIQNNEPISTRDFMLQIWKEFNGHTPPFEIGIPVRLGWCVGALAEAYSWITRTPVTISRGSVNDATAMRYASGEKARQVLGYQPRVSMEEGLRRSCQVSRIASLYSGGQLHETDNSCQDYAAQVRSRRKAER